MNAIQFIQQHGVEKAREVVEGAPDLAEYYSTIDFLNGVCRHEHKAARC